ncbi:MULTISPECIES: transcriptional regulator TraR [Agrobacterium]|uniref:Transcriptional regulator TraR n=2 Tax=Agrobacterium tumefaciens complex TaxID=1183400 RepID=A0AAE6EIT9_AGRTU|nr:MULTISPECIES: transcriptional regulator TraR [Agrobacterium]ASK40615.1 transcriptional regulator TraR [Agrobacterium genomosp. 6]ASK41378.1 transcriptional regulator TraR [Agrobacterium genomosp. 6]QCL77571.1 transcriptional regulator TraR [Agrobacterium tumefaciens]QCL83061.1 transcriptional regulator TraR [Agrobacterium tumefaciens]CUX71335.1 Transcriptional activator protein TraR [Agrobacterium sp. NCPPB 925]
MQTWLEKLTDLAAIEGDESILKTGLADVADHFGFTGYAYLHIQHKHIIAMTNYHPDWRSLYFDRKFDALDPVVKRARSRKHIFAWSGEQERPGLSKEERAFYAHAADFGIRSGITIPIRTANGSMSMFTLASEKPAIDLDRQIDAVAAAATVGQLHARISFLRTTPTAENAAWLDPKEATYLRWIAVGMTMEEIADVEGVKYNSVRVKLREVMKRFDVRSKAHLTALAIRRKLI